MGRRTRPTTPRAASTTPSPNARASSSIASRSDRPCGCLARHYARAKPAGCPPMPIMAARLYDKGKLVRDLGPDEAIPDECAEGEFFWLGLSEPTPGELERLPQPFARKSAGWGKEG